MHDVLKIEKPDTRNVDMSKVFKYMIENRSPVQEAIIKTQHPEYLSWEKLKRKSWIPDEFSPEEFWSLIKMVRQGGITTPIENVDGTPFYWNKSQHYDQLLHQLDLNTGGRLIDVRVFSDEEKKSYVSRGIIEEAIASAQLEGAHTTREHAKKMIEEGRAPQNLGQKMILNNYQAMNKIKEELKNQPLTLDSLFELHTILAKGTLDDQDQIGRFRRDDEDIYVGSDDGIVSYVPPKIDFVNDQIKRLVDFANDELEGDTVFIHPVIKAILLHFWIGFLHPFADGNGRIARALFYWYLLRKGYWAFAFIPVSTRIKKSPVQYSRSYINSEQDDNDLTYFIDYNLRQIEHARRDFMKYISKQADQNKKIDEIAKEFSELNYRQLELINYFRACPEERTNLTAMQKLNGVSAVTASKDLKTMVEMNLLFHRKKGRHIFYYPTLELLQGGD